MNELMWVIVGIPNLICLAFVIRFLIRRTMRKSIEKRTPRYALFPYNSGYFPAAEYAKVPMTKDVHVRGHLRRYCAPKISRNDLEAIIEYQNNKLDPDFNLDPIRMINAKATIYKLQIPKDVLMIDERTHAFMIYLANALEPVTPIANTKAQEYQEHKPPLSDLYKNYSCLVVWSIVQLYFNRDGDAQHKPYLLHEWLITKKNVEGANRRVGFDTKLLTTDIIRSVITAYAIKTGIKIPRDYIRYDEVTIHFLNTMMKAEPEPSRIQRLRLV